ncbi:neuropeptide FF receptor 2-like [Dreissena polymorpha]|uniref:neuropeptide FF receptor 2-like n=1 Tax=Dreissena polymorpha TaxID=45954 RepID=UPI002263EC44|nr:neuropeptide FF receptor 2-like [Dreissena polymorpha]
MRAHTTTNKMASNNSTMLSNDTFLSDRVALVQQLNDKMARLMVPATVYICIMMVLGLVGNPMVCYYYGAKTKLTTNTFFIVILALYDVIVCAISMPTEIADIELFYTFEYNVACKILRFVNYFAGIGSILTLVAIATDRFKKICRLTKPQMGIRTAKFVSLGIIGIAILLSWPSLVIYGSIQVPIPNTYGLDLMGADCTSTKEVAYQKYVWVFNGVHFLLFVVLSVVLIVLYSIIGHTIFSHKKRLMMYTPSKNRTPSSTEVETSLSDCSQKMEDNMKGTEKGVIKPKTATQSLFTSIKRHSTVSKKSTDSHKPSGIDSEAVKITVVMVIVTIVFIVSFLPYLSLTVWRVVKRQHEAEFLSDAGLVWFKIGSRSFLLNSSLNPWIYGIFNSNFRQFFFGWICKKR